jgi:hypothetical protein
MLARGSAVAAAVACEAQPATMRQQAQAQIDELSSEVQRMLEQRNDALCTLQPLTSAYAVVGTSRGAGVQAGAAGRQRSHPLKILALLLSFNSSQRSAPSPQTA